MGLLAILLVLCRGLPLIFAALATASALTKGVLAGVTLALVGTLVTLLVRRRVRTNAACSVPPRAASPSPNLREVDLRT